MKEVEGHDVDAPAPRSDDEHEAPLRITREAALQKRRWLDGEDPRHGGIGGAS